MAEYILPLSKVRCMNCAGKIKASLSALPGIESVDVDTRQAVVRGETTLPPLLQAVTDLGYEAGYHHSLGLSGLSCCKCVKKVETELAAHPAIADFSVSKTHLSVTGTLPETELISIIEKLGFQVVDDNTVILALSGLNCGKCVAKVEKALNENPQISKFNVSKTRAEIKSAVDADGLISLINDLGFSAKLTDSSKPENSTAETESILTPEATPQTAAESTPIGNLANTSERQSKSDETVQLLLSGMTCASCVASVEKAIIAVPGVSHANVNLAERTALVSGHAPVESVISAITDAGYGAKQSEDEQTRRQKQQQQNEQNFRQHVRNAVIALAVGIPMMAWGVFGGSMMIDSTASQIGWGLVGLITFALLCTIGRHFYINSWKAFKHHRATMDTLVALGTGAAWLYSMMVVLLPDLFPDQARHVYFEASVMILGLITLGHALEARARSRTSKALEQLIDLQPQTAIIVSDDTEREVPLAEVKVGMLLRLHPGAKVPVDGRIEQGQSYLDESMLTGEPLPANKQPGDKLHAGTINQNGSLLFRAEQIGNDTMLARIISLVRQAQSSKPALAQMADTISAIFVPAVMIIAILTAMIWYYVGPEPSSIYMLVTATTVLIIACPCALGLATPMSVTVGVGRAAEYGVLIRNAEAMQVAADVDTVVLDKTGTLTEGKPKVIDCRSYSEISSEQLLTLAASLEQGSEHPLARAIITAAEETSLPLVPQSEFKALPGYGVQGKVSGHKLLLGNTKLMAKHDIDISAAKEDAKVIASQGATPIYVAVDNQLTGLMGISDPLRTDSIAAIKRLKKMRLEVVMLTGDTEITAKAIAKQAGIDTVIAGVLPDGKAAKIAELQQQGKRVAMVGDGINDAPALAQAEVGIAMGSGSDVAIESAQLTLIRHSLNGVADALELSSATLKNMKQNLFGAFIYNSLGIPVAAGVLFPLTGTLLSPVIAGAAMALSSITVVSNANRLRLFTPNHQEK
ncbi:Lead, cadmium, zinc and mercury transporting ATPase [Photobacterium marinum]|uniref:Copper-exporting P-type ATPase n=1 Tax=Photobacterium marinum TaxID=1056511 RepID=L8J992_9GAMM|nr:copper-translocating P-type ATPase [Photobacterium marinum]ELR64743.1 Lead, cadmium, zinc and mercury transporting ATPase [Photobacterium marinum]